VETFHNDDIDDVFNGALFAFFGGDGIDYFDLNDINDATNDGDGVYQLDSYRYLKNGVTYAYFDSSTERIQVIGDNSANDIYFTTNPGSFDSIAGAGGNDALYAGNFASFSGYGGNTFISGGDGGDALLVNDNNAGGNIQYDFNGGNSFAWTNGGVINGSFAYDATLEQMTLTQNTAGTTTNVRQIAPTLGLTIDGNSGDDSFFVGNGDLDNNGSAHLTISGSSGNDSLVYDDSLDTAVAGETETYTWNTIGMTKGSAVSIVAGGFETQTLKIGATNNALGTRNTVNLDSSNFSALISNPTGTRLTTINVGGGNLNGISGDVVSALDSIKQAIQGVSEYVTATAAAVEEQSTVTGEMSSSMQRAAAEAKAIAQRA
jgi:hypothetical protein